MNHLINDLLDLSSYESGTFTLNKERVDMSVIIKSVLERYEYITNEKSITVVYNLDEKCDVFGDQLRLEQVVINLVSNAFKCVNDNGKIRASLNGVA